jgi:beta-phosphoglucomutase-like phosphatase (HAD superfamily)
MIKFPCNYKALIFDLDGTLADTMPVHYKACQIVCNKYGFDFPEDFFYAEAGKPTLAVFELLMKKLGKDLDGSLLGIEKETVFLSLIQEVKPLDLIAEIAVFNKGKVPMAIGSGGQRRSVDLTLEAIGMSDYFDIIVSCDDVKKFKPNPETFLKAATQMNVAPKDCLVFEDGDLGINAARDGGMMVVDVRQFL